MTETRIPSTLRFGFALLYNLASRCIIHLISRERAMESINAFLRGRVLCKAE